MTKVNLAKDTIELKKIIREHSELPIIVLAGEDATGSDSYYTYCSRVKFNVGEVFCNDDAIDDNDCLYTDREEFEDDLRDFLCADHDDLGDEAFDALVKAEAAKYEDDWVKAIIIYVDN